MRCPVVRRRRAGRFAPTAVLASAALVLTTLLAGALGPPGAAAVSPADVQRAAAPQCPYSSKPVPPVDSSERVPPGSTSPPPLPVPDQPVGGPRLGGCGLVLPPGAPAPPRPIAFASWQLTDLDTGAVLAAKDPHGRQRPASLAKMLLGLLVARELDQREVIAGTRADANQEGSKVGIGPGGKYSVELLLKGLLMASGNDVAHAFAVHMGGMDKTLRRMNELAGEIGARDTRMPSPSGLDAPGGMSSAYDLSLIFRTAMNEPAFAKAVGTERLRFPGSRKNKFKKFWVYNDNQLLTGYPGDIGGKTGFTDDAQHTYANAAQRNGHRIALVMMYGTNNLDGKYRNARQLMDYGFRLADRGTEPVGRVLDPPRPQPVAENPRQDTRPAARQESDQGAVQQSGSPNPWLLAGVLVLLALVVIGVLVRRRSSPPD